MSKKDNILGKIIEFGIYGLIILSPLPAASVNEWSILFIQLTVLTMLAAYIGMTQKPDINRQLALSMKWPAIFFAGFFVFLILQMLPLPVDIVKSLTPESYISQARYMPDFDSSRLSTISLIPVYTLRKGLELLTYFILGFLIIRTVTGKKQLLNIVYALIISGCFQTIYGLIQLYNENPRILFYEKHYNIDSLTGTFVNRNHLSGYLEMIVPLCLALIILQVNKIRLSGLTWKQKVIRLSEKSASVLILIICATIIMSLGIILSKSRSGLFLNFFSYILFFGGVTLIFRRDINTNKWMKRVLILLFLAIVLFSMQLGISSALDRFDDDELLLGGRSTYWKNTWNIFKQYPIFGIGFGTFTFVYPDWESNGTPIRLFHAHNDHLEYLTELGILGFLLLMAGLTALIVICIHHWRRSSYSSAMMIAVGGGVGIANIMIHSFTDFNLHIPANMLLFSMVLSLSIAGIFFKRKNKHSSNIRHKNSV